MQNRFSTRLSARSFGWLATFAVALALPAAGQTGPGYLPAPDGTGVDPMQADPNPAVEDLGDQRYRIGTITLDQKSASFTIPGIVLRNEPPLEYIAVTKGGFKAYESLFELDASAYEFNIACVLIGLDPDKAKRSEYHFDTNPIGGDEVRITASWEDDGQRHDTPISALVAHPERQPDDDRWIYTGSTFGPDGTYMAQAYGPLIGFVHDPAAVIGHQAGIGLNQYGSVTATATVPTVGSTVTVTIKKVPSSSQPSTSASKRASTPAAAPNDHPVSPPSTTRADG